MPEIEFDVVKEFGELSENIKGWKREVNLVSWSGRDPKYDIRDWSPDHAKMGKGITLTAEEMKQLRDILDKMEL
jgi:hypothetical protein